MWNHVEWNEIMVYIKVYCKIVIRIIDIMENT